MKRSAHDARKFVVALARGLEVLRTFTPGEGLLGNQEIAARTGLPKATVTRLTYTLTQLGYLTHLERLEKYQLAPGRFGDRLFNARQHAHPPSGASAYAGAWRIMPAPRLRSAAATASTCSMSSIAARKSAVMLRLDLGSRIPIATTAMGRAMLAALPEKERDWLLRHIARRESKRWPKIALGIERARKDLASRGFTLSVGEWQTDVTAVGVPLIPADGSGIFAFNCGAPSFHFSRERLVNDIGPRLVNMVRNIEAELNGR